MQGAEQSTGATVCYQWYQGSSEDLRFFAPISGANSATYTVSTQNQADKFYFAAVWSTLNGKVSESVYSQVVKVKYNDGQLKITKHPTSENITAAGTAIFIAKADNAQQTQWRLVSPDGITVIEAASAASRFPGLSVTGADGERLTLKNVPLEMNGWSAMCVFAGAGKMTQTNAARLSVSKEAAPSPSPSPSPSPTATPAASPAVNQSSAPAVTAPVINIQPAPLTIREDGSAILSVSASASQGLNINYQWYRSETNGLNGSPIADGRNSSYAPRSPGYYYVGVWTSNGETDSELVYSVPVAVSAPEEPGDASQQPVKDKESSRAAVLVPVLAITVVLAVIGFGVWFLIRSLGGRKNRSDWDGFLDE